MTPDPGASYPHLASIAVHLVLGGSQGTSETSKSRKSDKIKKGHVRKIQGRHFPEKKSPCGTQLAHDKVVNRDKNGNDDIPYHIRLF